MIDLSKHGIKIKNKDLFETAVTHSSYANENNISSYERLEFLGDAVIELIVSEYLYKTTHLEEGGLSKLRASYVCENALVKYAYEINLVPFIKVGHGQEGNVNNAIIGDVFESVVAAIYLDSGYEIAKNFIYDVIIPNIKKGYNFFGDYKSTLQELVQTTRESLEYVLIKEDGPAHDKTFEVEVKIDGIVYGTGSGKSKKEAEQLAALAAINKQAK